MNDDTPREDRSTPRPGEPVSGSPADPAGTAGRDKSVLRPMLRQGADATVALASAA